MRVLHIIASVNPQTGGPIEGIHRLDEALTGQGSREIVSCDPPDSAFLQNLTIPVHAVGLTLGPIFQGRLPFGRYSYTPHLVRWLRNHIHNYDLVVVNGLWNYASLAAARVLPRAEVPYVVFTHGMLSGWFRRRHPLKHVAKQIFWSLFEGRLLARARTVLFTTEAEAEEAQGQFLGYRYRATVSGYGTTPPQLTPDQIGTFAGKCPAVRHRRYLLFLGRLHPIKGCDLLIEAFARSAANVGFDLVIAGPDRDGLAAALRALALRLGVADRVHWTGPLRGDAKWGALQGADALILPSHHESFGLSAAEALACGKPVLITDRVAIWKEVVEFSAGLAEPDTVDGVVRLLMSFAALSAEQRSSMSARASDLFAARYDMRVVSLRIQDILIRAAGRWQTHRD